MASPSLVEIVKETGRQGMKFIKGGLVGAVGLYALPTSTRKNLDYFDEEQYAKAAGWLIGSVASLVPLVSGVSGYTSNIDEVYTYDLLNNVMPILPKIAMAGTVLSGFYELVRYARQKVMERKTKQSR